jgi:hypothetical protein
MKVCPHKAFSLVSTHTVKLQGQAARGPGKLAPNGDEQQGTQGEEGGEKNVILLPSGVPHPSFTAIFAQLCWEHPGAQPGM